MVMVTVFPVRGSNTVMVITTSTATVTRPDWLILRYADCDPNNALCGIRLFLLVVTRQAGSRDYPTAMPARRLNWSVPFRGNTAVKVNIEIECTPAEARQFFGLPNVEPMQAAVMEQFQKKMLAEMDRNSPESIMQT